MKKEFVPYELAVRLKSLGFDEEGLGTYSVSGQVLPLKPYTTESKAILFQQAFRWFRENHKLNFECKTPDGKAGKWFPGIHKVYGFGNMFDNDGFATYEEAELACIEKLIELTFKSE